MELNEIVEGILDACEEDEMFSDELAEAMEALVRSIGSLADVDKSKEEYDKLKLAVVKRRWERLMEEPAPEYIMVEWMEETLDFFYEKEVPPRMELWAKRKFAIEYLNHRGRYVVGFNADEARARLMPVISPIELEGQKVGGTPLSSVPLLSHYQQVIDSLGLVVVKETGLPANTSSKPPAIDQSKFTKVFVEESDWDR